MKKKLIEKIGFGKVIGSVNLLILLLPTPALAQDVFLTGISKVGEILYDNSQAKRDIEEGFATLREKTPRYIVAPLEIVLPTIMALREQRFEIKYIKSF